MSSLFNTLDEYELFNGEYEALIALESILLEGIRKPENLSLQGLRRVSDKYESRPLEGSTKPENLSLQALRKYGADEYEGLSALESTLEGSTKPENVSLQVLRHITNSFSKDQIIGHGGCAEVYKGTLPNGRFVAVKKFYSHYTIEDKHFNQEVQSLIRTEHKNIVQFLGYCSHTEKKAMEYKGSFIYADIPERLLCFEYISNGSLQNHLSDELRGNEWHIRLQIIRGIAEGLHYLHKEKGIIHMDLKPLNILLDDDMVPKITDFGISRLDGISQTMSTDRLWSLGYCAPEYQLYGKISPKSDIYSLGVIIIELVTGSRERPIIANVCRRWRHRWRKSGNYKPLEYQQVSKCLELALRCMREQPTDRPHIEDMIIELNEMATDRHIICEPIESTVSENIPDDMLGIEPLELQLPFQLQRQISRSIQLSNVTDNCIAFRISTSSTLPYCIKPEKYILPRQSCCEVTVTLDAKKAPNYENHTKGEFYVESTRVDEGLTTANITDDVFRVEADKVVDKVTLTTCLRDSTELLQVYPSELSYPLDDLNRVLSFSLQLTNRTNDYIGFLFPMSSSNVIKYSLSRSKGILPPWSTCVVILKVQAQEAALLNAQHKYNVVVRGAIVSNDLKPEDVSLALFEKKTDVQDVMLDIVFVAPSQQQPSLHVPALEDQDDTTIMISSGGSIVTEFVEIYPSVLCFPFEPNKPIQSSISLVNKSEHAFCFIITLNTPEDKAYINIDVDQDYIWPHSTCSVHVTMKTDEYPLPHLGDFRILMAMCGRSELILKAMSHLVGKHPQLIKRIREGGGWACEVSLMAVICHPKQTTEATKKKEAIYTHKDFGSVLCMDVHPTQPWIVTAHSKYICLWKKEPETSAYAKTSFTELCNIFTCVKFIARTEWIVSGDNRGHIHVYTYNVDGLKKINRFRAHNGRIKSLAIHSTRPYLLSSSDGISLWNWDLDCKIAQVFCTVDCVRYMEFNAKDTMTFFNSCYKAGKFQDVDGSGTSGSDILIWNDNDTKWHQMNMRAGPAGVACCVQGSDRKYLYLAIGNSLCTSKMHKCTTRVQIWDMQSNRCVHTLEILVNDETRMDEWFKDDRTQIVAIACHPERPLLVHGTNRGDVHLWNFDTCRLEKTLSFGDGSIQGFGFIDTKHIKRLVIGFDDRIEMVEIDWPALTSHPSQS